MPAARLDYREQPVKAPTRTASEGSSLQQSVKTPTYDSR